MSANFKKVQGFSVVSFQGASEELVKAGVLFKVGNVRLGAIENNTLLLKDVTEDQFDLVEDIAEQCGLSHVGNFGEKVYLKKAEEIKACKPFRLTLHHNKWYFADNLKESFPFVLVRNSQVEASSDNEVQMYEVELFPVGDELPIKQSLPSEKLAEYGLRPARLDDFEMYDLIPPEDDQLVLIEAGVIQPRLASLQNFK